MVLAFFNKKGLIFTNIVPRGQKDNVNYIVKALTWVMRRLKLNCPELVQNQWYFHWDNTRVNTATVVQDWQAAGNIQILRQLPNLPHLAHTCFF